MISFYLSLISLPVPNRFSLLVVSLLFIKFLFPNNFLLLKKFPFPYYTAKCFILTLYSNLLLQQSTITFPYLIRLSWKNEQGTYQRKYEECDSGYKKPQRYSAIFGNWACYEQSQRHSS
jgi:hypothetical protein